jgi:peptidoglycan/xylan/chitin deacetylase (PgdA/CDA1 family)
VAGKRLRLWDRRLWDRSMSRTRDLTAQVVDRALLTFEGGSNHLVERGPGSEPAIALSFDDGPSPHNTIELLELLEEHDGRATFFAVGEEIAGREAIVERLLEQGHELGNHTYGHPRTVHLDRDELLREVVTTNERLASLGAEVRLIRPPFGKDRRRFAAVARELGMMVALWSVDSNDTRSETSAELASSVLRRAGPGAIVLLHDGGERRPRTIEACATIVPGLRRAGFRLVTISELIGASPPPGGSALDGLAPEHGDLVR